MELCRLHDEAGGEEGGRQQEGNLHKGAATQARCPCAQVNNNSSFKFKHLPKWDSSAEPCVQEEILAAGGGTGWQEGFPSHPWIAAH